MEDELQNSAYMLKDLGLKIYFELERPFPGNPEVHVRRSDLVVCRPFPPYDESPFRPCYPASDEITLVLKTLFRRHVI